MCLWITEALSLSVSDSTDCNIIVMEAFSHYLEPRMDKHYYSRIPCTIRYVLYFICMGGWY